MTINNSWKVFSILGDEREAGENDEICKHEWKIARRSFTRNLNCSAFRTLRNKCCLSHHVYGISFQQPRMIKIQRKGKIFYKLLEME